MLKMQLAAFSPFARVVYSKKIMKQKTILITGATGFLGSYVTREPFDAGFYLKLLVRKTPKIAKERLYEVFPATQIEKGIWNLKIGNSFVKEVTKELQKNPSYVFITGSAVCLSILRREMTLQQAFFKEKMEIKGDILSALKMNALFNCL